LVINRSKIASSFCPKWNSDVITKSSNYTWGQEASSWKGRITIQKNNTHFEDTQKALIIHGARKHPLERKNKH